MAVEVIMPKLGMAMKEGTVSTWNKKVGDKIEKGDLIASINSEKIEMELEAPADGSLLEITVAEGQGVPPGTVIGYIGQPGEKVSSPAGDADQPQAEKETAATLVAEKAEEKPVSFTAYAKSKNRVKISPVARKKAEAAGIDYKQLQGTGPGGRIVKADVERAIAANAAPSAQKQAKAQPAPAVQQAAPAEPNARREKVAGMRKVIADRMKASLQESAQLTMNMKVDVTEVFNLQKQLAETAQSHFDTKLSINDFISRAAVLALQKHPQMNSAYIEGEIHQFDSVHLGMAVALDNGLVVPVIQNAQNESLAQLAKKIKESAKRARQGELNQDEMSGSTFTITNLGAYGIEHFTPILNPPEAGILGVGAAVDTPVFRGEEVEKRSMLPLSLTFDHRVLDGAPAAAFLKTIKQLLEEPFTMLL